MKILERLALILFSIIILVIAITSCLVIFNIMELEKICNYINTIIQEESASKIILISSIICIILAIKALFFPSRLKKKEEIKSGILLENKDGRLLISKDTIENLVNSVVKSFKEVLDIQTKVILDIENNITVFITLLVREDSIIKELSSNIQTKIKETIKRNTDLEVNQININVKNIENVNDDNKSNTNVSKININNVQVNQKSEEEENNKEISIVK